MFLINVPVVAVALVAIAMLMPESRGADPSRLDGLGVVLSSLGLVGVTYGVIQAGQEGWSSTRAVAGLVIGAVALFGLCRLGASRHCVVHREPLVDLGLFRSARFTWGTVLATMVSFAMFGLLFAMPQYFQAVMGQDPLGSGIRLLPLIGGLVIGAGSRHPTAGSPVTHDATAARPPAPRLAANLVVAIGFAFMAVGLFLGATTTLGSGTGWAVFWFVICGFGLGFSLPATMNAALGALSPDRAGIGSGLIMACRQVGATIGVALLGQHLELRVPRPREHRPSPSVASPGDPKGRGHGDAGCAPARRCGTRALGPVRVRHLARRHAVRVRCDRARRDGSGPRLPAPTPCGHADACPRRVARRSRCP